MLGRQQQHIHDTLHATPGERGVLAGARAPACRAAQQPPRRYSRCAIPPLLLLPVLRAVTAWMCSPNAPQAAGRVWHDTLPARTVLLLPAGASRQL